MDWDHRPHWAQYDVIMCIVHINSSVWYSVFVVVHIHVHVLFVLCVLSVMFFNSSWYVMMMMMK